MEVMVKRKRAAAYCRVSTDLEMQEGSFEWQKRHYTEMLSGNPDVELVHVYGDEGCSGRYADRRPEFQQMLKDCEDGKIDVIYRKNAIVEVLQECGNGWLRIKCPESRTGYAYVSNEEGQYAFVGKGLYTVAARDNLWKIAEKQLGNGTRYTEIRQLNGLTCNIIRVGMPLILPEK